MMNTYYLASEKWIVHPTDPHPVPDELIAFLFGTYLKHLPVDKEPGKFDGVSIYDRAVKVVGQRRIVCIVVCGEVRQEVQEVSR
jgi:hypothetical protein